MQFDIRDVIGLINQGRFEAVILHEVGHVLGIGTLWSNSFPNGNRCGASTACRAAGSSTDGFPYSAPDECFATEEYATLDWDDVLRSGVPPTERAGGAGTMCAHWDEGTPYDTPDGSRPSGTNNFSDELMTGFLSAQFNPLSAITVGSLADIGYGVDFDAADEFPALINSLDHAHDHLHGHADDLEYGDCLSRNTEYIYTDHDGLTAGRAPGKASTGANKTSDISPQLKMMRRMMLEDMDGKLTAAPVSE
ncbi:unnamed protein product [Chrysoparadoxa australica]